MGTYKSKFFQRGDQNKLDTGSKKITTGVTVTAPEKTATKLPNTLETSSISIAGKPSYGKQTLTTVSGTVESAKKTVADNKRRAEWLKEQRSGPVESAMKETGNLLNSKPNLKAEEERKFDAAVQGASDEGLKQLRQGLESGAEKQKELGNLNGEKDRLSKLKAVNAEQKERETKAYHESEREKQAGYEQEAAGQADFAATVEESRKSHLYEETNIFSKNAGTINKISRLLSAQENGKGALTDTQEETLRYYAGKKQWDRAKEYLESIEKDVRTVQAGKESEAIREVSEKAPALGVIMNAAASFTTPAAWLANTVQAGKNAATGKNEPTDTSSGWFAGARVAEATAEGVAKAAENMPVFGKMEIGGQNIGSFIAETGLSMGQFLSKVPLGPLSLAYIGAGAAGDSTHENLERGTSAAEAFTLGTAAGLIEVATEKVGLDNLFAILNSEGKWGVKAVLGQIASQVGSEGAEEAVSEIANNLVDLAVMGERAELRGYISELTQSGMSQSEAEATAIKQYFLVNTMWAAAGGALSGGVMGAGAVTVNLAGQTIVNVKTGKEVELSGFQLEAIQYGLLYDKESKSYRQAKKIYDKLTTEETASVSNLDIGKMVRMMNEEKAEYGPQDPSGRATVTQTIKDYAAEQQRKKNEKVISPEAQVYMELGIDATKADAAAEVARRVMDGDTTLTNRFIEKLELQNPEMRAAFTKATGIEAGKALDRSETVRAVRQIIAEQAQKEESRRVYAETVAKEYLEAQNQENAKAEEIAQNTQEAATEILGKAIEAEESRATAEGGSANGEEQNVSGGDGGRVPGTGAGGENGILAESRPRSAVDAGREAVERQNTGKSLRLQKVSSEELKVENGTEERTLRVLPEESWDEKLRETARQVKEKTGRTVTAVLGKIQIQGEKGELIRVRGVYDSDRIIVQADNFKVSAEQIANHEIFHAYAADNAGLVQAVERAIVERYGQEELDSILDTYVKKLRGVVNISEDMTEEDLQVAMKVIREEVFADAYAGINAFGTDGEKYQGETRRVLEERGIEKPEKETARATENRTGPPKYSISEAEDGRAVAVVDSDILENIDTTAWDDTKKAQAKAAAKEALLAFKNGIQVNGITYKINKVSRDEYTRSNNTEKLYKNKKETFADKMRAAAYADDVVTATTSWAQDGGLTHPRTDNFVDFVHGNVLIQAGANQYEARTVVGITGSGEYVFYDVVDMEPSAFDTKEKKEPIPAAAGNNAASAIQKGSSGTKIAQKSAAVNGENVGSTGQKYSFAGEKARGADLEALETAQRMRELDVADDVILRETGWFTGADGKWRFEIDDSGMEFRKDGDARLMEEEGYRRLQALTDLWAEKVSEGKDLTAEESAEMERLQEEYSDRVWEEKYNITDFVKHDELFRQYPRLRGVSLVFAGLEGGEKGYYSKVDNTIVLSDTLFGKEADVVLHEIQHAIQRYEGFSGGSSPFYWAAQDAENGTVKNRLNREREEIFRNLGREEQNQYTRYKELERELERLSDAEDGTEDGDRYIRYDRESDALYLELWGKEWFQKLATLDRKLESGLGEEYNRLYRDTAGEIEARDTAVRRNLTAEERRNTMPDRGNENTVFAENARYSLDEDVDAAEETGYNADMTEAETAALLSYKSSESYKVNAKLRDGIELTEAERQMAARLDGALEKLPKVQGTVYRTLNFDDVFDPEGEFNAFAELHTEGGIVRYKAYTSASTKTDGYPLADGARYGVIMEIISENARDLAGNGNNFESEVLFPRGTFFDVAQVATDEKGRVHIYMKEMQANVQGNQSEHDTQKRSVAVRDVQKTHSAHDDLRGVSEADPTGDFRWGQNLQEAREKISEEMQRDAQGNQPEYDTEERGKTVQQVRETGELYGDLPEVPGENPKQGAERGGLPGVRDEGTKRETRYSVDEDGGLTAENADTEAKKGRTKKPIAKSQPIIAKQDLKQNLLNLFSVPEGMRKELGNYVDQMAERMLKNGELSQKDRDAFFDRMYESGVVSVAADEYYQTARQEVVERKIYVPEGVKHEFGDDWNGFRKRAFSAGVWFTNNKTDNGIDSINAELAQILPGLFDANNLDERSILERIVQMAEEGQDEKVSLAEYTARLAGENYVSEDEVLDNIERQMDWALRTFAEKAKLEIRLRDRTGVKIAQEREKFSESRTKLEARLRDRAEAKASKEKERNDERRQRERARRMVREANERERRKEMSQRQRERKELRELQQKTLKALQWLNKNSYRASPEVKETWKETLGDIDLLAVGAANEMNWSKRYNATWGDLAQMYKDARANDPNFLPSKELQNIVDRLDKTKIAEMDAGALQDLYKAAVGLREEFYNRNNVINDDLNRTFADVYESSKEELQAAAKTRGAEKARKGGKLDKILNEEQLSPMNVMQRMAGWNPDSAFYSMAKQLERGERDMRAYKVKAQRMLIEFLTENESWVKRADGQGKDAIWYEIEVPKLAELNMGDKPTFGDTVKVYMTPSQKVHLYLESKNYDSLRHIAYGGRTFADKELYSQGKRTEAYRQAKPVKLAPETVKKLVSDLTTEERALADILERYYNQFASEEINRVSNALYGYDKAVNKNYAPIYTDQNFTKGEIGVFDATAEGVGNLKQRQRGTNATYNIDAFEAFERHVDKTALFAGMAIPARNWNTLLGWRDQENSMKSAIAHAWGKSGVDYIEDIIIKLQDGKATKKTATEEFTDKVFSNYIGAVFGANPSIVLKQMGSIPLAAGWLDFKNLPSVSQIRGIDRNLINRYTQDLEWRTLGYSMPETATLKENPNWTQSNKFVSFVFGGDAITAMDGWAASVLWPWAENKVRRENPSLEVGTQEQIDSGKSPFYQKVAEEFNDAVARSQSTSDEMHQGTMRKSKSLINKTLTMFKSDASQTYNALRQRAGEAAYYKSIGDAEKTKEANRRLGTTFLAAVGGYAWAQAVGIAMALWKHRDDDYRDEEGNLSAVNMAKELAIGVVGDLAGVVVGGEEIAEIIGNVLSGDRWYGIETPGLEQITDVIETITSEAKSSGKLIKGAINIQSNGGDLKEYIHRNLGDIIGGVKELAMAVATYIPGVPVNNLESYLLGTVRWVLPEAATTYDNLLETASKGGLKGSNGEELERGIDAVFDVRRIKTDGETTAALARLYEAGNATVIPTDTPSKITVDGVEHELTAYQKQQYDKAWANAVGDSLKELTAYEGFRSTNDAAKKKMISCLYNYATAKAKAALFEGYDQGGTIDEADAAIEKGATLAEWAAAEGEQLALAEKYFTLSQQSQYDSAMKTVEESAIWERADEKAQETAENYLTELIAGNYDGQAAREKIDSLDEKESTGEKSKAKLEAGAQYGLDEVDYILLQLALAECDIEVGGSYTNAETEEAIEMLPGLSDEARSYLWTDVMKKNEKKDPWG